MIVELMGIPGAGKTTIATALQERLREYDLRVPQNTSPPIRFRKARRIGSALQYRHALAIALGALSWSSRPTSDKLFAAKLLVVAVDNARMAHAEQNGVYVFPEGMAQRCFLLFVDRGGVANESTLERFVGRCPCPDLLVHVEIDAAVALHRLQVRSRGLPPRLAGLANEQALDRLRGGHALLQATALAFERQGAQVVKVSGAVPTSTAVDVVVAGMASREVK